MPEYLSPGVYVEEQDVGPKPIEGVSTSTAGAVGVTARGPDQGKPVLVTSFAEFQRKFGAMFDVPEGKRNDFATSDEGGEFWNFPLSVKGFFDNGGQRLYVKRVVSKNAKASSTTLGTGVISVARADAPATATRLQLEHLINVQVGTEYDVVIAGNTTKRKVKSYDQASRSVEFETALGDRVRAGRDYVVTTAGSGSNAITLDAYATGLWGDDVRVQVGAVVAATLNVLAKSSEKEVRGTISADSTDAAKFNVKPTTGAVTDVKNGDTVLVDGVAYVASADAVGNDVTVTVPVRWKKAAQVECKAKSVKGEIDADSTDAARFKLKLPPTTGKPDDIKKGDVVTVDGAPFEVALDTPTTGDVTVKASPAWKKGASVARLRLAASKTDTTVNVWGASALYPNAVVELDNGSAKTITTVDSVAGNAVTLGAAVNIDLHERDKIRLIEVGVRGTYGTGDGSVAETFDGLRLHDDPADPAPDYLPRRLLGSALVRVAASAGTVDITDLADFPRGDDPSLPPGWAQMANGDDDIQGVDADAFVGGDAGPGKRTGIAALEDIDEISICMAPGMWAPSIHGALITHCELLKDRFAIIDPPRTTDDVEAIRAFREAIDTKYAALYWPWIAVRDPYAGRTVELGPSGHVAGIYARVDVERGVHKAPANEVIRGIDLTNDRHGLRLEITKREQDLLNPKAINALRFFPDRGTRVWGARVLTSDSSWKYVNVRRLFIYVEESIDEGTQWVVFEPNDEPLWARVRQSVGNFLTSVWRSGALQGATADEAFFVKCDYTTMTQDDIDNGRLICVVGIAPVKPAEFVIFRIQQKTLDRQTT